MITTVDSILHEVKELIKEDRIEEALNVVSRAKPSCGERRNSLRLILDKVKTFESGPKRDQILGRLVSMCFQAYDIDDTPCTAIALINDQKIAEPLAELLAKAITDRIALGQDSS